MFLSPRRSALSALVVLLLASPLFAQQKPWDAPAFTADAKALIAAAQSVKTDDFAVTMLLDEAEYVLDDDGGMRSKERIMIYVVSEAGVESSSEVRAPWQPWYGEKPTIEGRVITRDGSVHTMDQSALVEVPTDEEADIFSDGRILRAPLPAVAAGSVIEYVISRKSKHPIPGAGTSVRYAFGGYTPVERTRVTLDAPLSAPPRIINKTGIEPRVEEKNGRRRSVYQADRIEGQREVDEYVPYDVAINPFLSFSTGKPWQELATNYSAIVDKQIAGNDLEKMVRAAIGKSTDRNEVVAKLLAAIQKDVRYAGIEIGEGSIVPRTPKQVLANKYGDCKDKAALLVAMLRTAGFPASVVLLNAGSGPNVSEEMPALNYFNHAIVIVEGTPAIWVDPTDVFARPNELPLLDQGRMALIAKPETTTLVMTPETESTANVYRETRTFLLPEDGKARVTEVSEPTANTESSLRRWVSGLDPKDLRESLESYVKSAYVAKTMSKYETSATNDLTKPFRMTLEVPESESGIVNNGEGAVVINIGALPQQVPDLLRDWREPQPGESADDAPKKRTHDFLFPQPGVREWVYRIVPPTGYTPRTLPPTETKKVGTTTYSQEVHQEPDNTVVATFRFDSGKRRLTAAEFQETRVAFTKFVDDNLVTIGFEQAGQTKLNAGDVRGALDEFRRLTQLHPKEAQHHIEIARALLGGGLGDAARDEIRRAIAIEPKNARAHQMLGTILMNDPLGRPYRRGFDLAGAIAAFRKAKELKPDDYSIRLALTSALTYGNDGLLYSPGAHVEEAIAEVLAMIKDLGDEGKKTQADLTVMYSHLGRFADVRTLAPTLEDEQQRDLARIIATAALEGTDAAVRELSAFDQQRKRSYASGVAQLMMQVRLYPQAAALMDLATQGTPAAAEQQQFINILKKLKRIEDTPVDDGPRGVIAKMFHALMFNDAKSLVDLLPPEYAAASKESPLESLSKMDLRPPDILPLMVFNDLIASIFDVQQEGDDESGYRLRVRALGTSSANDLTFMVRKENGKWLIRGASTAEPLTGASVLGMAEKGELEVARKWLNWAREDAKGGTNDDPLEGKPFAALWSRGKTTATADEIRIAAASMATDELSWKKSEPILVAGREQVQSDAAKAAIDLTLVTIYDARKDWPKMLAATSRLIAAYPDSPTAFSKHIDALLQNGKSEEATALATQRLERMVGDRDATHARALIAAHAGDYTTAQKYATEVVDKLRAKPEDYAFAAWISLFTGEQFDRATEHAQQALKELKDNRPDSRSVHALAGVYAAMGRSIEARAALLKGLDDAHRGTLLDADWYVLGRIAENYGVEEYAIAAYRKVKPQSGGVATVSELAKRRLDGLKKQ